MDSKSKTIEYFGYQPLDELAWTAMAIFIALGAGMLYANSKFKPCRLCVHLILPYFFVPC